MEELMLVNLLYAATHHSDSCSHSLGRQILTKLCTHNPTVAMWPCHTPPDHPEFAWLFLSPLLGFLVYPINVCHSLTQVEICIFANRDTIKF